MAAFSIAVLPGDGVGPEVTAAALEALAAVGHLHEHHFHVRRHPFGGAAIDLVGEPLPQATLEACLQADAVLLGAVGGPQWDGAAKRPEQGLLALRRAMGLYANLRPLAVSPAMAHRSPLRREIVEGVDLLVVRELTGGLYFGAKARTAAGASDVCEYSAAEVERVARVAFAMARARGGRVASVDKANVLETSRLWREVVSRVHAEAFPDVRLEHVLVDAMAMHLVRRPRDFDVILTENLFGDILSDEISAFGGSIGLAPSASIDDRAGGLYEPIHGSAPDIAGQDRANPLGAILAMAMLLRHGLGLEDEAVAVERAAAKALDGGRSTPDLGGALGTRAVGAAVVEELYAPHRAARDCPSMHWA